jgi:hypothetical protein
MKKMVLALVAVISMSTAVMAQNEEKKVFRSIDKKEMIQHHTDAMVKRYQLSEKQAKLLLELNKKYADKLPMMGMPHYRLHVQGLRQMLRDSIVNMPRPDFDKMKKIAQPNRDKVMEKRQKMMGKRQEMIEKHQKMMETKQAYEEELKSNLGADKYEQYQQDIKEHMKRADRKYPINKSE